MNKKIIILLFLLAMIFGLCTNVNAAESLDQSRLCSLILTLEFDGTPLEDGGLTLYRVGQIDFDDKSFVLVEPLSHSNLSLDNLQDPTLAKELNILAVEHDLKPYKSSVKGGKAVFSDLQSGLYVVTQSVGEETQGYAPINPFLISMPQWQNDTYVYDLTAAPKVPLLPASTESTELTEPYIPTEPDDIPELPQTGQLNWPVPLMAVSGLALFGIGWSLYFSSKRRGI